MGDDERGSSLEKYRRGTGADLYGWSVDGVIVSIAGVSSTGTYGRLEHIATDPSVERKGYGAALVHTLVETLNLLYLVAETDDDAVSFYRRCGFTVTPVDSPWPGNRYQCVFVASNDSRAKPF